MKKIQKIEKTVKLVNGMEAKIVIGRGGQEPLGVSDKVWAYGRLYLPAKEVPLNGTRLREELRFEKRLTILYQHLGWGWGSNHSTNDNKFVYEEIRQTGTKWAEIFEALETTLEEEIEKLNEALKQRQKALDNAE
jgi:hypothetical protein